MRVLCSALLWRSSSRPSVRPSGRIGRFSKEMWTTSTNDAAVSRSRGRRRLRSIRATSRAQSAATAHARCRLPMDGWAYQRRRRSCRSPGGREGARALPHSCVQHPGRPLPPSLLHPPREATEERLLRLGLGWTGRAANEPEQGGQAGRGLAGQVIGEGRRRWLLLVLNSPWQRVRCARRLRRRKEQTELLEPFSSAERKRTTSSTPTSCRSVWPRRRSEKASYRV